MSKFASNPASLCWGLCSALVLMDDDRLIWKYFKTVTMLAVLHVYKVPEKKKWMLGKAKKVFMLKEDHLRLYHYLSDKPQI